MTGIDFLTEFENSGYEVDIYHHLIPSLSKDGVNNLAEKLYDDRGTDPAEALIKLKVIENAVKLAADRIKENHVINKIQFKFAELTCVRDRKYDFSDDSQWTEIEGKIEKFKKLQKERENFLRSLVAPVEEFSKETGESLGITLPAKLIKDAEMIKITIR